MEPDKEPIVNIMEEDYYTSKIDSNIDDDDQDKKEDTSVKLANPMDWGKPVINSVPPLHGDTEKSTASIQTSNKDQEHLCPLDPLPPKPQPSTTKNTIKTIYKQLPKMVHEKDCICPICMRNTQKRKLGAIPKRKLTFEANYAGHAVDANTGKPTPQVTLGVCLRNENGHYKRIEWIRAMPDS